MSLPQRPTSTLMKSANCSAVTFAGSSAWDAKRSRMSGRASASGLELDYRRPNDFARYLREQRERFADIIKKNNIRIE